jgi:hypothetical protein
MSETKQSAILGVCFVAVFLGLCVYFGKYAPQLSAEKPVKASMIPAPPPKVTVVKVKDWWMDDPKKRRTDIVTRQ